MTTARRRVKDLVRRTGRGLSSVLGITSQIERSVPRAIRSTEGVAKYFPARSGDFSVLWAPGRVSGPFVEADLPVPPPRLWMCFEGDEAEYRELGQRDVATMRSLLAQAGYEPADGDGILDFGCAAGRMTRWLADIADRCAIWGTDIQEAHVDWCHEHLTPPFRFFTTTTFPHLPMTDGAFRMVFAGSVFTNMAELADSWLLELHRVIEPGGFLYLTVHDRHSIEVVRSFPPEHKLHFLTRQLEDLDRREHILDGPWGVLTLRGTAFSTQVFHDVEFIRERWSSLFDVRVVEQDAYLFQTALVLQRRA
jgi:SAM-dependent methyltransferase